jgi:hypothetical protein
MAMHPRMHGGPCSRSGLTRGTHERRTLGGTAPATLVAKAALDGGDETVRWRQLGGTRLQARWHSPAHAVDGVSRPMASVVELNGGYGDKFSGGLQRKEKWSEDGQANAAVKCYGDDGSPLTKDGAAAASRAIASAGFDVV